MDLMDMQDLSFIDINELGVRPFWKDEENEIDYDQQTKTLLGKERLINQEEVCSEKLEDIPMADEDDSNYQIDPETGEKTPRETVSSDETWIEEYLTNIESSSNRQFLPVTSSDLLFENIPPNTEQTDANWLATYMSLDESSARNPPFAERYALSSAPVTSPIFIPTSHPATSNSLTALSSVSFDDEQSVSSSHSSNFYSPRQLFSITESDSLTQDSELTFDGSFIETKLEKIEHDEHFLPSLLHRRLSTRSNYQGLQDEETLRFYSIPLTLYDITQSSTDEYNRHIARLSHLTPEQLHVIKDIRRRGKNKIAAQNCRKRKANNVESLLDEVDDLKRMKHELQERKRAYQQQILETRHSYEYLHRQVLPDRQLLPAISVQ